MIIALSFGACSTTPQPKTGGVTPSKTDHKTAKKQQTPVQQTKSTSTIPNWILNPHKPNCICDVGSSASQPTPKMTQKVALMTAKANISKQIKLYISTKLQTSKDNKGNSTLTTSSNQQSTNMIRDIKITDKYQNKEDNRLYLRVCTPIQK